MHAVAEVPAAAEPIPDLSALEAAIAHLAACRRVHRAAAGAAAELLVQFHQQHLAILDSAKLAKASEAHAEAAVRRIAEARYAVDPSKCPVPGVTMRPCEELAYDAVAALEWAREKQLFLTAPALDRPAFEAFALHCLTHGSDAAVAVATVRRFGKATIANDLDRVQQPAGGVA